MNQKTYKKQYVVEKILGRKWDDQTNQFLYKIKWVGWGLDNCTWEPVKHLNNVLYMVIEYDKENKIEQSDITQGNEQSNDYLSNEKSQKSEKTKKSKDLSSSQSQKQIKRQTKLQLNSENDENEKKSNSQTNQNKSKSQNSNPKKRTKKQDLSISSSQQNKKNQNNDTNISQFQLQNSNISHPTQKKMNHNESNKDQNKEEFDFDQEFQDTINFIESNHPNIGNSKLIKVNQILVPLEENKEIQKQNTLFSIELLNNKNQIISNIIAGYQFLVKSQPQFMANYLYQISTVSQNSININLSANQQK